MSFFDDDDDFSGADLPPLRANLDVLEEPTFPNENENNNNDEEEDIDAFNSETFANEMSGDWEAEHDKLIALEGDGDSDGEGGGGLDRTLTKLDDVDEEAEGDEDEENEDDGDYDDYGGNDVQQKSKQPIIQQQQQQQQQKIIHQQQQQSQFSNNNMNMNMNNQNWLERSQLMLQMDIQRLVILQNELKAKIVQSNVPIDQNSDQFKLFQQIQFQLQLKQKQQQQIIMQQQFLNQIKNQTNANVLEAFLQNAAVQQLQQQQNNFQNKLPIPTATAANLSNFMSNASTNNDQARLQSMLAALTQQQQHQQQLQQQQQQQQDSAARNNPSPQNFDDNKLQDLMEKFGQINLASLQAQQLHQQQLQQLQHQKTKQMNSNQQDQQQKPPAAVTATNMLNLIQQQQQQKLLQSAIPPPPNLTAPLQSPVQVQLPPPPKLSQVKLPNVKTLEEIENELLNNNTSLNTNSSATTAANPKSNSDKPNFQQQSILSNMLNNNNQQQPQDEQQNNINRLFTSMLNNMPANVPVAHQQAQAHQNPQAYVQSQQMELMKYLPFLTSYLNNTNNLNNLNEQQQKQLYQIFAFQQSLLQQQQLLGFTPVNAPFQNELLLQQQQLASIIGQLNNNTNNSNSNNNNNLHNHLNLPPNFQNLNPQQKQLILNQLNLFQQQQQQQNQQHSDHKANMMIDGFLSDDEYSRSNQNQHQNNNNRNRNDYNSENTNRQRNNNNNNYRNNQRNFNNNNNSNNNTATGSDKLAGMMTEKEKNWVVNVQMLQLQIDDPYNLDFYYTAWNLKKKQFSMQNASQFALKTSVLFQSTNKHDPKNYRPLIFENSLGKVTMSNFHHPRALIDINKGGDQIQQANNALAAHIDGLDYDDEGEENKKEKKNICTILLEIEKMYQVYLNIDEIEHKILKAPDEMRASLFQERRVRVDKLASMMCSENFAHYLFVPKGKRLLGKCIPTFNIHQTKLILGFFMQYIYIISKNNISLDEIYSQLSYAIDTQKFNDLVEIVNHFVPLYSRQSNQLYQTIFSNKFGLTYLLKFFSKSELINQDDYDNDIKTIWSSYLNLVLNGLSLVQPTLMSSDGNLDWNIAESCQLNPKTILDNFSINLDLWSTNEKKLKELFIFVND